MRETILPDPVPSSRRKAYLVHPDPKRGDARRDQAEALEEARALVQALGALAFLPVKVLERPPGDAGQFTRAKRPPCGETVNTQGLLYFTRASARPQPGRLFER